MAKRKVKNILDDLASLLVPGANKTPSWNPSAILRKRALVDSSSSRGSKKAKGEFPNKSYGDSDPLLAWLEDPLLPMALL